METFCNYVLLFMSYSFLGWLIEMVCCSIDQKKIVLNRGFCLGPYCPIYGFAAIGMILFLNKYLDDPIVLFVMSAVGASVLEYLTSYVMEKLFKARWWDYYDNSFNINGRICLQNSILFGLLGVFLLCVLNPFYTSILLKIPVLVRCIIAFVLLFIFVFDNIISFVTVFQIRSNAVLLLQDSTALISKQVKEILSKNRVLKKRLLEAFPRAKVLNQEKILGTIRQTLKKMGRKS